MANLTITAASVVPDSSAQLKYGISGATIAQGDALYLDSVTNTLKLAVATSAAAAAFVGIAVNAAAAGQPVTYIAGGLVTIGATVALGQIYCVSATAGKLCPHADLVSTNYVTFVGMPTTTAIINVAFKVSGVQVA